MALKKDGEINKKKQRLVADDLTEENNLDFLLRNIYIQVHMIKTYCSVHLRCIKSQVSN